VFSGLNQEKIFHKEKVPILLIIQIRSILEKELRWKYLDNLSTRIFPLGIYHDDIICCYKPTHKSFFVYQRYIFLRLSIRENCKISIFIFKSQVYQQNALTSNHICSYCSQGFIADLFQYKSV